MPPLTTENAGALMGGGVIRGTEEEKNMQAPAKPAAEQRVKVLRSFQDHKREIAKVGTVVTLPRLLAIEMRAANKVEFVVSEVEEQVKAPVPAPQKDAKPAATGGQTGERK